jgi:heptaprenyl diphosphate synthase
MAFQVVDDILDVIATDEELGKPAGHDIAEGIYNLPVIRALAGEGGAELRPLLGGPLGGAELERARKLVRASDGVAQSIEVARRYVDEAVAGLEPYGERPAAVALRGAARHLVAAL